MDTIGARLSRSSTRYGPISNTASSFSGPVRKWRKAWVPITGGVEAGFTGMGPMGVARDNNVVLFMWAPVNGATGGGGGDDHEAATRRRFVPVFVGFLGFRILLETWDRRNNADSTWMSFSYLIGEIRFGKMVL
ncbi:hypothetical protein ABZP36_036228 [Zizania latifolia]